jgi:hypothetical protein
VINGLRCDLVVCRPRIHDAGNVSLRIPIIERKPAALDLYHQPMTALERMGHLGHREGLIRRLVWGHRSWGTEALSIATAKYVGRDHEFVAAHAGLGGILVGENIDQLDDPINVGASRSGD